MGGVVDDVFQRNRLDAISSESLVLLEAYASEHKQADEGDHCSDTGYDGDPLGLASSATANLLLSGGGREAFVVVVAVAIVVAPWQQSTSGDIRLARRTSGRSHRSW